MESGAEGDDEEKEKLTKRKLWPKSKMKIKDGRKSFSIMHFF